MLRLEEKALEPVLDGAEAHFPRSNPHYVLRATPVDEDVLLYPGNDKARMWLHRAAGEAEDPPGRFRYRQGEIHTLFPEDFQDILHRIAGTSEVVEVEWLRNGERHYWHVYTPFVDNRSEIFVEVADMTRQVENERLRTMRMILRNFV